MATLHIEHAVTSYPEWKVAFDRAAGLRDTAGCRGHRVSQPVDDVQYLLIDLDFDTAEEAHRFRSVLEQRVWATPANSPALVGSPTARVLEVLDAAPADQAFLAARAPS